VAHSSGQPEAGAWRKRGLTLNEENLVMRVTIFGTGYVGLVTGTCLAEVGNDGRPRVCFRNAGERAGDRDLATPYAAVARREVVHQP